MLRTSMTPKTHAHLAKVDPVIGRLIQAVGPCPLTPLPDRSPFEALLRAVAHQQLNGTAAETILRRFLALFPGERFPQPEEVAAMPDEAIRAAGFSRSKLAAIRDICAKTISGVVPHREALAALPDEEIIQRLTECRGVGRWTVEMFLMFTLGRPDVLPVDDFGVRNGYRIAYGLGEMPSPKELLAAGECWRPHRTTASWYLWRAVDLSREAAVAKPTPKKKRKAGGKAAPKSRPNPARRKSRKPAAPAKPAKARKSAKSGTRRAAGGRG